MKGKREKSPLELWAENEVEIVLKDCDEYTAACYKAALEVYKKMLSQNHSGLSWNVTKNILDKLMNSQPLTPITEKDFENIEPCSLQGDDGTITYQCPRMSSLFKDVFADGTIIYKDIDRTVLVNTYKPNSYWHSSLSDRVVDELFPITLPYCPKSKQYKVYAEEFLFDEHGGDYDTVGILYVITPEGQRINVYRYYKEGEHKFVQIDEKAYLDCSNELDWTNADLEIGYDTIEEVEILNVEF